MSDEKIVERFERFAGEFLVGLAEGPRVIAGPPLSPVWLEVFALAPGDDAVRDRIAKGLDRRASAIAPLRGSPYPPRGAMAIAMAAHNLACLTDPQMDRLFARGAIPKIVAMVERFTREAGAPETRTDALVRHVLVSRFLALRRKDVVVRTWAYTHRFFGRAVPPRMVAMPAIRMVRKAETEQSIDDLLRAAGLEAPLLALVARSPVTQLLDTRDIELATSTLAVLSDPALRGGIARALVQQDGAHARVARAIEKLAHASPPPRLLHAALALAVEMWMVTALDRAPVKERRASAFRGDAQLFPALLSAAMERPRSLAPLMELGADDRARLVEYETRYPAHAEALDRARTLIELAAFRDEPRSARPNENDREPI